MVTFDDTEYERWVQTAQNHLRVARHNAEGGFYSAAVLQAEQAAQCGLKALLHGVGQTQATRGHGLLSLAEACRQWAGLAFDDELRESLARLARDYQPTRYPDALPEGTPMSHYGKRDVARAESVATQVLVAVTGVWADLVRQARQDGGPA